MKNLPFVTLLSSVVLMTIFSSNTFSPHPQEINQSLTDTTDNYLPYYEKIREALIYYKDDKDYPKTVETFKEAFDMVSSPMAMDVLDALHASIAMDSKEDMFYFARIFVEKGCEAPFFEREDLQALKDYPEEFEALMNHIDYVQANAEQYWNVELRKQLTYLFEEDQRIAKKYKYTDSLKALYPNWVLCPEYDTIVKRPFLELVKKYGIVGLPDVGFALRKNGKALAATPYIIMLHILQRGENRFTRKELEDCVKQGILSEFHVKQLIDTAKNNYRLYPEIRAMIERGADEDSISMRMIKEWRLF